MLATSNIDKIISSYFSDHQSFLTYPWFLYIISGAFIFPSGFHTILSIFLQRKSTFLCQNVDDQYEISKDIVQEICEMENATSSRTIENHCYLDFKLKQLNNGNNTIPCPLSNLNYTLDHQTVVTEFNLVCENSFYNTLINIGYFLGFFFGAILSGFISDNYGRKTAVFVGSLGMVLTDIIACYSTSFIMYGIVRSMNGIAANTCYVASVVLVMEMANPRYRALVGCSAASAFFCFGMAMTSIWAYMWPNWRDLQFWSFLVVLPNFLILLEVKESCRWLYAKGKFDELSVVLRHIWGRIGGPYDLIVNKSSGYSIETIEDHLDDLLENNETGRASVSVNTTNKLSMLDLFKHGQNMTKITFILMYIWFVASLIFYGANMSGAKLPLNLYLSNFIMASLSATIGPFLAYFGIEIIGRKKTISYGTLTASILWLCQTFLRTQLNCLAENSLLFFKILPESSINILIVILESGVRIFSVVLFASIYTFTAELYPTQIRGNAVGIGSMASRIGGMCVPIILSLAAYKSWLPSVIISSLGIFAGLFSLYLPETKGVKMLKSFEEAQKFYVASLQK